MDTGNWSRPVAGVWQVHWLGDSEGRSELARGRRLKEVRLHTALAIEMACWKDMVLGKAGGHGKTVPRFISQPTHFNKLFVQSTNSPLSSGHDPNRSPDHASIHHEPTYCSNSFFVYHSALLYTISPTKYVSLVGRGNRGQDKVLAGMSSSSI